MEVGQVETVGIEPSLPGLAPNSHYRERRGAFLDDAQESLVPDTEDPRGAPNRQKLGWLHTITVIRLFRSSETRARSSFESPGGASVRRGRGEARWG